MEAVSPSGVSVEHGPAGLSGLRAVFAPRHLELAGCRERRRDGPWLLWHQPERLGRGGGRNGGSGGLRGTGGDRATQRHDQEPGRISAKPDREGKGRQVLGLADAHGALAPAARLHEAGVKALTWQDGCTKAALPVFATSGARNHAASLRFRGRRLTGEKGQSALAAEEPAWGFRRRSRSKR